jgi:bisphosphoglycerate-dependent phosphoglycerate mutase
MHLKTCEGFSKFLRLNSRHYGKTQGIEKEVDLKLNKPRANRQKNPNRKPNSQVLNF